MGPGISIARLFWDALKCALRGGFGAKIQDEFDFAGMGADLGGDFAGGVATVGEVVNAAILGVFVGSGIWDGGRVARGGGCVAGDLGVEGFKSFDFFIGFGEQGVEPGGAVVHLGGELAGGVVQFHEEGIEFAGDGAEFTGGYAGGLRGGACVIVGAGPAGVATVGAGILTSLGLLSFDAGDDPKQQDPGDGERQPHPGSEHRVKSRISEHDAQHTDPIHDRQGWGRR